MDATSFPLHKSLGQLSDGDLTLEISDLYLVEQSPWLVPAYRFTMLVGRDPAGTISLRIGADRGALFFAGQVGFAVEPLWFTCEPNNIASRRTLELLGAQYQETVALPVEYEAYERGEREKCRFYLSAYQRCQGRLPALKFARLAPFRTGLSMAGCL